MAIKLLHARFAANEGLVKRFLREPLIANQLSHPGVVRIRETGLAQGGVPFVVMDLLEGQTVQALRASSGGRLPVERALQIAERVLSVLVHAHGSGIVHRDIKPANLFITEQGELKVLDFGVARLQTISVSTSGTGVGSLLGTPAYMAPEQARGRWDLVDARTDLWAVGATLFELLGGESVHRATTGNELLGLAMTSPARSLREVAPELPRNVVAVVDRALRYYPAQRWASAEQMRQAVLDALSEAPCSSSSPESLANTQVPTIVDSTRRSPQRPRLPRVAVIAAASTAGLLVFYFSSRNRANVPPVPTSAGEPERSLAAASASPPFGAVPPAFSRELAPVTVDTAPALPTRSANGAQVKTPSMRVSPSRATPQPPPRTSLARGTAAPASASAAAVAKESDPLDRRL